MTVKTFVRTKRRARWIRRPAFLQQRLSKSSRVSLRVQSGLKRAIRHLILVLFFYAAPNRVQDMASPLLEIQEN
jgi:hypothetical protein